MQDCAAHDRARLNFSFNNRHEPHPDSAPPLIGSNVLKGSHFSLSASLYNTVWLGGNGCLFFPLIVAMSQNLCAWKTGAVL